MRVSLFRSGYRKSLMATVRGACGGFSNVIVGPTTCARADITVLSTMGTINMPAIRMRVSSIFSHRSFERVDFVHTTYIGAVDNENASNCLRTVSFLGDRCNSGW